MRIPATLVRKPVIKKSWYDKNDPQVHLVYRMEREFIGWNVTTQHSAKYLRSIIKHACKKWNVDSPALVISSRPKDKVYGSCYTDKIWLNSYKEKPGNNIGTLLHELAHWITDKSYGDDLPGHGPDFLFVYGQLLEQYKLFPFECFITLCRKYDVCINTDRTAP